MELQEAVRNRRSIRSFLSKPVPEELIQALIAESRWAPSWGNTQPWEIVVATGTLLERFKKENKEAILSDRPSDPEVPMPQDWPDALKKRYKDLGKRVFRSLALERTDIEGRRRHFGRMFFLFDAPALILMTIHKGLSIEYSMLDIGLFLQTFCLLAFDEGLGTCIMAAAVRYPEIAHKIFSIPETKRLVIGVALGWPDPDAPVNRFERERRNIDEFLCWA